MLCTQNLLLFFDLLFVRIRLFKCFLPLILHILLNRFGLCLGSFPLCLFRGLRLIMFLLLECLCPLLRLLGCLFLLLFQRLSIGLQGSVLLGEHFLALPGSIPFQFDFLFGWSLWLLLFFLVGRLFTI